MTRPRMPPHPCGRSRRSGTSSPCSFPSRSRSTSRRSRSSSIESRSFPRTPPSRAGRESSEGRTRSSLLAVKRAASYLPRSTTAPRSLPLPLSGVRDPRGGGRRDTLADLRLGPRAALESPRVALRWALRGRDRCDRVLEDHLLGPAPRVEDDREPVERLDPSGQPLAAAQIDRDARAGLAGEV